MRSSIRRVLAASAFLAVLASGGTALVSAAHAAPVATLNTARPAASNPASQCRYIWVAISDNLPGFCI